MSLFRKECGYCKTKINKGEEVFRTVIDPVYIGTSQKAFCCSEHADGFKESMKHLKRCSSCCG